MGKEIWVEFAVDDGKGTLLHLLYKGEIGFLPLKKAGPTIEVRRDGRVACLTPIDACGKCIVFWDEKPAEPYFKDGWPEWEVLGGERDETV